MTLREEDEESNNSDFSTGIAVGIIIMLFIVGFGLLIWWGEMNDIDYDEQAITSKYVKKWYPEFENCTVEHREGTAFVYCTEQIMEDRDDISMAQYPKPDYKLNIDLSVQEMTDKLIADAYKTDIAHCQGEK